MARAVKAVVKRIFGWTEKKSSSRDLMRNRFDFHEDFYTILFGLVSKEVISRAHGELVRRLRDTLVSMC